MSSRSDCQSCTQKGEQCKNKSKLSTNFCHLHQKSQIGDSSIPSLPPLGIPSCYLMNPLDSDRLYGNLQIFDQLKKCGVDTAQFLTEKEGLDKKYQYLLDQCQSLFSENIELVGQVITEHFNLIDKHLITPQLNIDQFNSYTKLIDEHVKTIKNLIKNDDTYIKIGQEMIQIIKTSSQYEDAKGILEYLNSWLLHLQYSTQNYNLSQKFGDIKQQINSYAKINLRFIKKYTNMIENQYYQYHSQFSLKTVPAKTETMITIKKDILVYKGVDKSDISRLRDQKHYFWVAYDLPTSNSYIVRKGKSLGQLKNICDKFGRIGIYRTIDDFELLNMNNPKTIKKLIKEINDYYIKNEKNETDDVESIISHLKQAFPVMVHWETQNETVGRNSTYTIDLELGKWLCRLGYDGYTANNFGGFPSEIMVCETYKHLEYIGYYDTDSLGYHYCKSPYIDYDINL